MNTNQQLGSKNVFNVFRVIDGSRQQQQQQKNAADFQDF